MNLEGEVLRNQRLTRQIVPLPSSLIRRLPSLATVIPSGRPQTFPLGVTIPVTKSKQDADNFGSSARGQSLQSILAESPEVGGSKVR